MKVLRTPALLLALCCGTVSAWAQNAIQSITGSQQGGSDVIRVELSEALSALPQGFVVQSPPRIAIDLPGVGNALGRNSVEINQGLLRSVNIAQGGERTRLVLNLKQAARYTAQIDGKTLLLQLQTASGEVPVAPPAVAAAAPAAAAAAAAPATAAESAVRFAEPATGPAQPLRNIDFRRGGDGSGRVIVDLSSNQVGVDIRQQGQALLVEFLQSSVPPALSRKLDVTDFGTPVKSVATFQIGDKVRMLIEPSGNWEHSAYQTDTQFVLEVRSVKVDPNKLSPGPGYTGEKLSLNFQSIEVRALLQVIADFTNFNVVTSDTVSGSVTLRLKDVPWDQALDIILQAKNLGVRKNGNVLFIAPKDEIAAKEKAELEARKQIQELEPVRTQSFQLNYSKAEDISKLLTGTSGSGTGSSAGVTSAGAGGGTTGGASTSNRILSVRGSVGFEARTNQLFVTDIPSKLEEVAGIIAKVDIPVRQVVIEARIVEANDSFGRALGVRLGAVDRSLANGNLPGYGVGGSGRIGIGTNYLSLSQSLNTGTVQTPAAAAAANAYFVNLPTTGLTTAPGIAPATFAVSLFSEAANRFLNLEISALEAEGKGKVISSPRIVTADQIKARIAQGTEIPYQSAAPGAAGGTQVQFKKAELSLSVTPQITPEGSILLDVLINKNSRGQDTINGPSINTKEVETQVLVENGGTVVIGGIFEQEDFNAENKVPVLGDIPAFGNLFKQRSRESRRTELLVFLTPKVITDRSSVTR